MIAAGIHRTAHACDIPLIPCGMDCAWNITLCIFSHRPYTRTSTSRTTRQSRNCGEMVLVYLWQQMACFRKFVGLHNFIVWFWQLWRFGFIYSFSASPPQSVAVSHHPYRSDYYCDWKYNKRSAAWTLRSWFHRGLFLISFSALCHCEDTEEYYCRSCKHDVVVNHAVTCLWEIYLAAVGFSANTCERIDIVNVENIALRIGQSDHCFSVSCVLDFSMRRQRWWEPYRCTLLIPQMSIDMTTISKWLGHKNVTATMNIYEHILDKGRGSLRTALLMLFSER